MNQIKIREAKSASADLMVVNAARVSFNRWKEEFDEKDASLINYLAREKHTTPFRQPRIAFYIPGDAARELLGTCMNPFMRAGLVVHEHPREDAYIVKHSLFGWSQLLKDVYSKADLYLSRLAPNSWPKLLLHTGADKYTKVLNGVDIQHIPEEDLVQFNNPWLLDMTFRCQVPIWLARQLVKHQVGMVWSEVSRRYVDDNVEVFNQELRMRPAGGIKQGSGPVVTRGTVPHLLLVEHSDLPRCLTEWYNWAIDSGIAPETARGNLPLNLMTTFIWTGHLPAFKNMVNLRIDGHAQKEAQYFAKQMDELMQDHPYAEQWRTCNV